MSNDASKTQQKEETLKQVDKKQSSEKVLKIENLSKDNTKDVS